MVHVFDSNKETVDVNDVHGEKNLLLLTTSTEDGCLLHGESSGKHDKVNTICLPQVSGNAGVDLVLGDKVQGLPGSSFVPLIEKGELVEESLKVIMFHEGADLVASMSKGEGGLTHLRKE